MRWWPFGKGKDKAAPKRRQRWGAPRAVVRRYQAANTGRLEASWPETVTTPNAEIARAQRRVRGRSRHEARNNPIIRRYLRLLRQNVVGPVGIIYQAQVKKRKGQLDTDANDALESWFKRWGRVCDFYGELSWLKIQNVVITTLAKDGEIFIELVPTMDGGRLKLIDPELCPIDYHADLGDGRYIQMGIEYRADGSRAGYWIHKNGGAQDINLSGTGYGFVNTTGRQQLRFVPAARMLHLLDPDDVDQSRGMPWTTAVLWRLQMHHGYTDAAVTASRVGASNMAFIETPTGSEYTGDDEEEPDGPQIIDAAEPGIFEEVPTGTKVHPFNPTYPHQQFASFDKSMHRSHAAGLNVAYNALANDLEGVNFSSIRSGVLEDREAYKSAQQLLIEDLCMRVMAFALPIALQLGHVKVAGARAPLNIDKLDKFSAGRWQARRWAWVDPLKDMTTNRLSYELGAMTISEMIRDTGRDPEEVWRERKRETEAMAELGVTPQLVLDNLAPALVAEGGDNDET